MGVNALVRDTVRAATRLPAGVTLFPWDVVAGPPPTAAFEGVDVVVNLAGESDRRRALVGGAPQAAARQPHRRHARAGQRDPRPGDEAARASSARRRVGYYGDRGDEILTEASTSGTGFLAELRARLGRGGACAPPRSGCAWWCCATVPCCRARAASCARCCRSFGWARAAGSAAARSGFPGFTSRTDRAHPPCHRHRQGVGRAERCRARAGHQPRAHHRARRGAVAPDGAGRARVRVAPGAGRTWPRSWCWRASA